MSDDFWSDEPQELSDKDKIKMSDTKFKVGDKVKDWKGQISTVIRICPGLLYSIGVDGTDGRVIYYQEKELMPVEEPAAEPLKLEVGKRYVCRDGKVTGPLTENNKVPQESRDIYPFKDSVSYETYTSNGRYYFPDKELRDQDLVAEYVEPKQGSNEKVKLPEEPTPGKKYKTKDGLAVTFLCKTRRYWLYETENDKLFSYEFPFKHNKAVPSSRDIVGEWKEPVTLPAVEIKRWVVVQSKDNPTITTLKRGHVICIINTKQEAEDYMEYHAEEDEEIVEMTGTLPARYIDTEGNVDGDERRKETPK